MSDINIQDALPIGTMLNSPIRSYKIVSVLGGGGFGITYKVSSVLMVDNVPVVTFFALKEHFMKGCYRADDKITVMSPPSLKDDMEDSRRDFIAEAKRLNRLSGLSQNIVRVNEVFEEFETAYYVMQFLDGGDLYELVESNGPIQEAIALSVIRPVAEAVGLIHKERLLHLDIKPENILLMNSPIDGRRYPVLIDFGIAKHFSKNGKPTSLHNAKGASPGYAPQEQYADIDSFAPEMDVYALGATLLFLLSGKTPKKAFDITERDILNQIPENVSKRTREAIINAMKLRRDERTASAMEFLESLEEEYTLPVGFIIRGNKGNVYQITSFVSEEAENIVYNAVILNSDGDNDIKKDSQQNVEKGATVSLTKNRNHVRTKVLKGTEKRHEENSFASLMIFEMFVKALCKRKDDGTVTGVNDDLVKKFNAAIRRKEERKEFAKGKNGVFIEECEANGTIYKIYGLRPVPSWWKRMNNGLSAAIAVVMNVTGAFFKTVGRCFKALMGHRTKRIM